MKVINADYTRLYTDGPQASSAVPAELFAGSGKAIYPAGHAGKVRQRKVEKRSLLQGDKASGSFIRAVIRLLANQRVPSF